jgi:hypothetical protein
VTIFFIVRATVDVAMICRTYVRHGVKNPKRSDIKTSIGADNASLSENNGS